MALPSSYLYLKTNLTEDIKSGVFMDHFIELLYKNSKAILDINGKEIKINATGFAYLNSY